MKNNRILALALGLAMIVPPLSAQLKVNKGLLRMGDNPEWKNPKTDDSSWQTVDLTRTWQDNGIDPKTNFGWYRIHFTPTAEMIRNSDYGKVIVFDLGQIDDADQTFLNGKLIGSTGQIPENGKEYKTAWSQLRTYSISANDKALKIGEDNVLAIRVYNGDGIGGMSRKGLEMKVPSLLETISLDVKVDETPGARKATVGMKSADKLSGTVDMKLTDFATGKVLSQKSVKVGGKEKTLTMDLPAPVDEQVVFTAIYADTRNGKSLKKSISPKYILTPKAPETPRFNTAPLYGVRPGSPVHYRFGVSGVRPMKFSSNDLPAGLSINPENGALSGKIDKRGDYTFTVVASNAKGTASQKFTLKVGDKIALTPPMGWNSWNCWGLSVTQDRVISSAQALIDKGLADYGYAYINIDDGWEAPARAADGKILVNEKFPSMKALGDWLHNEGLKFGIYSSPGDYTCGHYLGSLDHEQQDAESYNDWGIDYLKYDWCGYNSKHPTQADRNLVSSYIRPYMLMEYYLREQPRDIFYSLCQYGMADVWEWGPFVDANSWRTTGDITDTWESMKDIGFDQQAGLAPYARPGHWNDPDMLIVGKVGWSDNLRDSRLTPDEQYTHISLWSLLASNMLIGCDIAQMDDFTVGLLCNNEVNAVNQDILGKQATQDIVDGDIQIWTRPLADGTRAVGIFNLGSDARKVDFAKYLKQLNLTPAGFRDLWRQTDIPATETLWNIPAHGVKFIKVK